jgi:enoyl-CoA hydratase/carnithine racemase
MSRLATENQYLTYEKIEQHVAVVTLNRPDKRNAINPEITQGFDRYVRLSETDPEVRVVILASSNDAVFCAGADLQEVARNNLDALHTKAGGFAGFAYCPRTKPWIAAPQGVTVGGGLEICLACDMIVAADNCRFGLPEVKRSLIAAAGGIARLSRMLPLAVALELIATGEPIDAARAYALGLVNKIVPVAETLAAATQLARQIAANAPLAVRTAIRVSKEASCLDDAAGRRVVHAGMTEIMATEDFLEGPRAFLEKRAPRWKGR